MKTRRMLMIVIVIISCLLILDIFFHLEYFNKMYKSIKPTSEAEKQKALEILAKNISIEGYQINFGNIYFVKDKEIIKIELKNSTSRKDYLIDLKEGIILRR